MPAKITAPQETATIDNKDAATKQPEALLSYREAVKLVAGVLRGNPDSSVVVEVIRDIVSGTGLDVTYEPQEEGQEEI